MDTVVSGESYEERRSRQSVSSNKGKWIVVRQTIDVFLQESPDSN